MKILQIGSHKGYDDLTEMVKKNKFSEVDILILVEPQQEFNDSLSLCYSGYNFIIENLVITDNENQKTCKFYSCVEEKNKEISSLEKNHLMKHNQFNYVEKEHTCMTLNNLLKIYDIKSLDILFIDSEGFDDKIIKSIDFDTFDIKKIYYENLHINDDDLTEFLTQKKYKLNKNILLNGWTNEAIKIY